MSDSTSLRERSKARRRHSIQLAAMQLIAERGYEGTTIVDIATRADVAPRTVTGYFPTKLDIALASMSDLISRLTAVFREQSEISFTDAIDVWLTRESHSAGSDLMVATFQMLRANPALHAVSTTQMAEIEEVAAAALLAECGLDQNHPLTKVMGAAIGGAIGEYFIEILPTWNVDTHRMFISYLRVLVSSAGRVG